MNTASQNVNYSEMNAMVARLKEINDKLQALQHERQGLIGKLRFCQESLANDIDRLCCDIPVLVTSTAPLELSRPDKLSD